MSKPKKLQSITDWDWTNLVAAWRYFERGKTIASATFPSEIVSRYFRGDYERETCDRIANQYAKIDHGTHGYDDLTHRDDRVDCYESGWCKFYSFCRAWCDGFKTLTVSDGKQTETIEAFYCEGNMRWYPKDAYIKAPANEIWIPEEYIKEIEGEGEKGEE